MKASPTCYGLRLVDFFCDVSCAIFVHSRSKVKDLVVDDGAKIGDGEKRTLLHRQRKSAKNNVMVSLS